MENQQALTEAEKGWICGFFDGEGCVNMNVANNHSAGKIKTARNVVLIPRLMAVNTDYATIMKYRDLFSRADVGMHIEKRVRNNPRHQPAYAATIRGHKRCQKAIPVLLSNCLTKKASLEAMWRWLCHREDSEYQYSMRDYELYQEFMKASNKSPNDSTLRRLYDSCNSIRYKPRGIKDAR